MVLKKKMKSAASFTPIRFGLLCVAILGCLGLLLARVGWLQIVSPDNLVKQEDMRSLREEPVAVERGMISDREGRPLAVSVPVSAIWIDPQTTMEKGGVGYGPRWQAMAEALHLNLGELAQRVQSHPHARFLYLARQINPEQAREALEPYLKEGKDILYIAFSSGLSGTYNSIRMAAEELQEEYPERKLIVIDSLCSSSGYGLLVDGAADLRDEGKSMDEITDWVLEKRKKVHHQFYSTELKFYRRSGRMSDAAAAIGTVLGICPIMRLDDKGRIIAYDKVRGKKNAVARTVETMKRHAENGENYSGKAFICHSNCLADAKATKAAVEAAFPHLNGEVRICDIGTIVASHSGPGTVAVFFFGDDRAPEGSPV